MDYGNILAICNGLKFKRILTNASKYKQQFFNLCKWSMIPENSQDESLTGMILNQTCFFFWGGGGGGHIITLHYSTL